MSALSSTCSNLFPFVGIGYLLVSKPMRSIYIRLHRRYSLNPDWGHSQIAGAKKHLVRSASRLGVAIVSVGVVYATSMISNSHLRIGAQIVTGIACLMISPSSFYLGLSGMAYCHGVRSLIQQGVSSSGLTALGVGLLALELFKRVTKTAPQGLMERYFFPSVLRDYSDELRESLSKQ